MKIDNDYDYTLRIVIAGDSCVGKTTLLTKLIHNVYDKNITLTVGVDFSVYIQSLITHNVKLQIWDTGGQERYRSIILSYLKNAAGILLVYDVTNLESFNNLENWLTNIKKYANSDTKVYLVGNKCDMNNNRLVTYKQGLEFAQSHNIDFCEISVLNNINLNIPFEKLCTNVLNSGENHSGVKKYDYLTTIDKSHQLSYVCCSIL